ncbi:MAG: hypothetical protein ACREGH_00435 [Minisyncoccia bacterium]
MAIATAFNFSSWGRQFGWTCFYYVGGRYLARLAYFFPSVVVRVPAQLHARFNGYKLPESDHKTVWLERARLYGRIGHHASTSWELSDGTILDAQTPVLQLHIRSELLYRVSVSDPARFLVAEILSLSERLEDYPDETIMYAQLNLSLVRLAWELFGAEIRDLPYCLHLVLDTFFRQLVLFGYSRNPRQAVLKEPRRVYEIAVSLKKARQKIAKHRQRK